MFNRRINILCILLACFSITKAQTLYTGTIGSLPITFAFGHPWDGFYYYDKYHIPIHLSGKKQGKELKLEENTGTTNKPATASFTFLFSDSLETYPKKLTGLWKNSSGSKTLSVTLSEKLSFDYYDSSAFSELEFPAFAATKEHYFMLLLSKKQGECANVTGLRVFNKKTNQMVQQIDFKKSADDNEKVEFEGTPFRFGTTTIGDYNFDGREDLDLFTGQWYGANTSHDIYTRDSIGEKYSFAIDLYGTDISIDSASKKIMVSSNGANGTYVSNKTYTVVANRIELLEEKCWNYNDSHDSLINGDCNN